MKTYHPFEFMFLDLASKEESSNINNLGPIHLKVFDDTEIKKGLNLDQSQLRTMSRTAKLMIWSAILNNVKEKLEGKDLSKTGLYCSLYASPFPYEVFQESGSSTYLNSINQHLHPLNILHRSNAVSTSHLSAFLGVTGPSFTFTHKKWALMHSFEQAKFDLDRGGIEFAMVVSANALKDDPLRLIEGNTQNDTTYSEGVFFAGTSVISDAFLSQLRKSDLAESVHGIISPVSSMF